MRTWLFIWNADRWAWDDYLTGYQELKSDIENIGHAYLKWSCGVNKSIEAGDRIFMIKLGSAPKGIVASGYALTNVFEGTHWDDERKKLGKKARRVYIDFDCIRDYQSEDILGFDILKSISDEYHWSSQSSGIEIPQSIAAELENKWKELCK